MQIARRETEINSSTSCDSCMVVVVDAFDLQRPKLPVSHDFCDLELNAI